MLIQMDSDMEEAIKACHICQKEWPSPAKKPCWYQWKLRGLGAKQAYICLCHLENLCAIIFTFLRPSYQNTTAKLVTLHITSLFARHDTPDLVMSDSVPQCNGHEHKQFAGKYGFLSQHQNSKASTKK